VKEYPQTVAAAVETGSLSYLITKNGYALEIIMVISWQHHYLLPHQL
jgi:hypothetical protein